MVRKIKSVLVYGPPGSGKTFNADKIRALFGMPRVEDGVSLTDLPCPPKNRCLYLTNESPSPSLRKVLTANGYAVFNLTDIKGALK